MKNYYGGIPLRLCLLEHFKRWKKYNKSGVSNKYNTCGTFYFINKNSKSAIQDYFNNRLQISFTEDGEPFVDVQFLKQMFCTFNFELSLKDYLLSFIIYRSNGFNKSKDLIIHQNSYLIDTSDKEEKALSNIFNILNEFSNKEKDYIPLDRSYTMYFYEKIKAPEKDLLYDKISERYKDLMELFNFECKHPVFNIIYTLQQMMGVNHDYRYNDLLLKFLNMYNKMGSKIGCDLDLLLEYKSLTAEDLNSYPGKLCGILMKKAPRLSAIFVDFVANEEDYALEMMMNNIRNKVV